MAILTGSFYMDVFAIIVSLVVVAVAYLKWSFTYWKRQGVYTQPPTIPFGNASDLFMQKSAIGVKLRDVYHDIRSKGKKYGGFYLFGRPIFIPADLDLVKSIMTKDFNHFTDHANFIDEKVDPLTGHLFALKGLKWKNLRTRLTPTFTSGKMKMMFQTLLDCSKDLIVVVDEAIDSKQGIDIKDIAGRFTTDIIGSCAFGIECNSLKNPNSEFREYGKKIFDTSLRNAITGLLSMTAPQLLSLLKLRFVSKEVYDFLTSVVEQTVGYREKNNIIRKDFMHLLIQLKNNVKIIEHDMGELKNNHESNGIAKTTETTLTIDQITAQTFVFFAAGFETSSTTTTFCLYELAQQQKLQDKLREEIVTILDKHGSLTYEAIMEMTYMDKCIDETLRKYPPVPVHTRECTQTYHVPDSDIIIEKGMAVFISAMGIQYDEEYYPDPQKFDPERFSEESKAQRHSSTWTPFGDGPRTCIGLRFGIMQTKVGLAILLKNYKFSLNSKTEVPLTMDAGGFILSAAKGVLLDATKV